MKVSDKSQAMNLLIHSNIYIYSLAGRVLANGSGDQSSIRGQVIKKMVFDAALLNTQQYKVQIKNKVEESRERSSTLPYTLVL